MTPFRPRARTNAAVLVASLSLAALGGCADGGGEGPVSPPDVDASALEDRAVPDVPAVQAAALPAGSVVDPLDVARVGEPMGAEGEAEVLLTDAAAPTIQVDGDETSGESPVTFVGGIDPVAEEPSTSETPAAALANEVLVAVEPTVEEGIAEEPAAEEPAVEESAVEEPAVEAPPPERIVRIDAPAEREALAGTLLRFPIEAFDGESSRPRLELIDAPSDASLRRHSDGASEFLWQTDESDVGETLVTVEAYASDGEARAGASVLLRVLPTAGAGEAPGSDEPSETVAEPTSRPEGSSGLDASSPLRELARELDLRVGFAAYHDLEGDLFTIPDSDVYIGLATTEYDIVTPENSMKMSFIQPERGRFVWDMADRIVDFAEGVGMAVHGHPLVWRQQNPDWVLALDREARAEAMREHVAALVSRYRGRIAVWDVVNEALENDGQLVHTTWYRALGEGYFGEAFRVAHANDPDAALIYNDYAVHVGNPKSDALHALLERELASGTPVHGVGLQMHLRTDTTQFDAMRANMRRFAELGLDIYITEMDVATDWRADPIVEAERQAHVYAETLRVCLEEPRCRALQTWGLSDRHAWRGALSALPFDERFAPKPAVQAMREVMVEFIGAGARQRSARAR